LVVIQSNPNEAFTLKEMRHNLARTFIFDTRDFENCMKYATHRKVVMASEGGVTTGSSEICRLTGRRNMQGG